MTEPERRVNVVPCGGVGRAQGTVCREAAYELTETLRPASTRVVALARLVLGDDEARRLVAGAPAIAIDGCKHRCAAKLVQQSGGLLVEEVTMMDVCRRHRRLKPRGIAQLDADGLALARLLAEELMVRVDSLTVAAVAVPGA